MYLQDNGLQLDAAGVAFFQRELELIKAKSVDVVYADLPARDLFPVNNEGGFGITSITYESFDKTGSAKIINGAAHDLPRADAGGKEITNNVREVGTSYAWTQKEIASAARSGRPINTKRAEAANRAIEEVVNDIALFGNAAHGLPGFFSNENIPSSTVPAVNSSTEWSGKTPDEIYLDVVNLLDGVWINSKMRFRPDTLLLPPAQHSILTRTRMRDGTDTVIAEFIVKNSRFINSIDNIVAVNELAGAGAGGLDMMACYKRSSDVVELEVPAELQFLPAQEKGLEMIVPAWLSICGVVVYYPLSCAFAIGI